MQTVDAAQTDDMLDLGETDARHGMVCVRVLLRQAQEDSARAGEVILGQELPGLAEGLGVLDELVGAQRRVAHAVDEFGWRSH